MKFSYHYLLQLNYYLAKLKHLCLIWKFCEWNWKPIYPCEPNYKNSCNILNYYRDYTEVWSCNTLKKKKKKKNLYFLVTNIFSVSKLSMWYFYMSSIDLVTRFKNWRLNAFPCSTDIIQVLIELPTDKRHIRVQHDRLLCLTHVDNKKKQVFENFLLSTCHTTRPQWSPLKIIKTW